MKNDFCGGPFWNLTLSWSETDPDLTFCFKQSVLIWVPCGFLWLFSLIDIHKRRSSNYRDIPWGLLNISKFFILLLLICLSCTELSMIMSIRSDVKIFGVQIVSISIKIVTFIYVAFLQLFHKIKGHRSSGLLFCFWLLLTFCAIPQLRWEIRNFDGNDFGDINWDGFQFINYVLFFSFSAIMLLLNCFIDKPPRTTTYRKAENPSPELNAGILNRSFFAWFDPTTWKGWKRPLTEKDIYEINPENTSKELVPEFDRNFKRSIAKNKMRQEKSSSKKTDYSQDDTNKSNGSIFSAMFRSFGSAFFYSAILKLFVELLQFASPLLLGALITYVATDGALWKGLLLTFALFAVAFTSAILNGQHLLTSYHVGFKIRSALISSIYRKSLRISSEAKRDTTVGEIVNLMAVDAHRFFEMIPYLHVAWSGPLVISLATFLLWQYLGVAVFSGLAVMIFMLPLSGYVATKIRTLQVHQMKIKDERVKSMNEILSGMKVLKLYAWEPSFEELITTTRSGELVVLRKAALFNAATEFFWNLTPFLVAFVSFLTFVMLGNVLTPQIAFVSMALFNILRMPMTLIPMVINFLMQAVVATKRLNKFMNAEELDETSVTNYPSKNAIEIKDGTFSWGGSEIILKNINLQVKKGKLSTVVGSVGSGKSSLISALLGEMIKIKGTVNIDGRVAYVPQQAWIQNATLRDNITFGKAFNKNFYQKVIEACALTADLAMLPGGDQTEIGEKGINLSGGQKQRVSLARAVYSGADIYILDDPLSAVDSHVGKHIFDNVLSETGILKGKTKFLITHAISFLPRVDEINVMLNGEISESGTCKQLLAQKGAFSELLIQYLQENPDSEIDESEILEDNLKFLLERSKLSEKLIDENNSFMESMKQRESISKPLQSKTESKLIDREEAATGKVNFGVYIRYFKSVGLVFTTMTLLFNITNQTFSVLSNIWLTRWSTDERAALYENWRNIYVGVYGGLGGFQAFALMASSVVFAVGALRAARDLHNRLLKNTMRLPMSSFDTTPLGRILNRFSKDVDVVDALLPNMMKNVLWMFFSVLAIFVVISYSTPVFLTVALPIAIMYFLVQKFYVCTSRQIRRIESITRSPIYSHFSETISGQSTIRAYNEQKRFIGESDTKVDANQAIAYLGVAANRWLAVRLELIGTLVVLFAALFAVMARNDIDEALVGLSVSYSLQISIIMSWFIRVLTEVETNIVSIERIEEYAERPQEAAWITKPVDPLWPKKGVVEFKNYQVRYREGLDLVLKGISFAAKSQEKIGIVGRTGAGKSSLALSLFRVIEGAGGKIIIDDVDISEIGLHSLRSRLTIIPQDPVLFSGSLRMNIDPFNAYNDDAIWLSLEHSHLKSFVKGLSEGLEYKITEGGENLSVGQRQLVCLSRALLRKTKVLILDEATAAIDVETDELIQKTIRSQFQDCTILTIAHRLGTVMDSDRIIVLDQGIIAEFDSPEALLANRNSIFYGMAKNAGLISEELNDENESENTKL